MAKAKAKKKVVSKGGAKKGSVKISCCPGGAGGMKR